MCIHTERKTLSSISYSSVFSFFINLKYRRSCSNAYNPELSVELKHWLRACKPKQILLKKSVFITRRNKFCMSNQNHFLISRSLVESSNPFLVFFFYWLSPFLEISSPWKILRILHLVYCTSFVGTEDFFSWNCFSKTNDWVRK